jgi:alkylation response protein AidB-like acyl-CoA dehydrogenase
MDFRDTPEEAAFRQEVREFIAREAPKIEGGGGGDADMISNYAQVFVQSQGWFKKLGEKGWIAPAWPKEYGGAGMTVMRRGRPGPCT